MYLSVVFEVVAASAADETLAVHVFFSLPFEVSQLRESVHNDTEDDVHQNSHEYDEETHIVQIPDRVMLEVLVLLRNQNVLKWMADSNG